MEFLRSMLTLAGACWLTLILTLGLHAGLKQGWRLAFLGALTVVGAFCWLITEVLGAVHALALPWIAISWGIAGIAATLSVGRIAAGPRRAALVAEWKELKQQAASLPVGILLQVVFIIVSAGTLAVIAYAAAPNTWDSMTYHLSRIMHWQQDRSLAFYATAIQRQLAFGPMAEIGMLNYRILAGSDRLVNFVQFFAMIGCVFGVSLLAERLGASPRGQVLAAFAAMTIPMGVLQATSTQNDYAVALWSLCFALFAIFQLQEGTSTILILLTGAALGLAVDTKVTALLYLACFGLWLAIGLVERDRLAAWRPTVAALLIGVVFVLPQAARNLNLYGNVLGEVPGPELSGYVNEAASPRIWISNIVRNLAAQLATPSSQLDQTIEGVVRQTHTIIGIDVNSPLSTWRGAHFHMVFTLHEDSASNPIDLILIVAAMAALIAARRSTAVALGACVLGAFLLMNVLLKWQPWNSRLELPLFVLSMPLLGLAASIYAPRRGASIAAFILGLVALPYLFANSTRPLLGANSVLVTDRIRQYFYYPSVPDTSASYLEVARALAAAKCGRVGLVISYDDREYLSWVTLAAYEPQVELEHILVKNLSSQYGVPFVPCGIVDTMTPTRDQLLYDGREYVRAYGGDQVALFLDSAWVP